MKHNNCCDSKTCLSKSLWHQEAHMAGDKKAQAWGQHIAHLHQSGSTFNSPEMGSREGLLAMAGMTCALGAELQLACARMSNTGRPLPRSWESFSGLCSWSKPPAQHSQLKLLSTGMAARYMHPQE